MIRRADVDKWLRFFQDRNVDPGLAEYWARQARSCIRLIPTEILEEDNLPPRSSKLRGEPDLPVGMEWPIRPPYPDPDKEVDPDIARDERPLDFIAQINLKDIAKVGCDLPLPTSGLLLFFYDTESPPVREHPSSARGWRVIYVNEDIATERQSTPLEESSVAPLRFKASDDVPCPDWIEQQLRDDARYTRETISDEVDKLMGEDDEGEEDEDRDSRESIYNGGHAFGGWYEPVQSPMERECEMASSGFGSDHPDYGAIYINPETKKRSLDWRLLLQIDSDLDLQFMWCDAGVIYFFCREQDIAEQRFDRAWVMLQTH